MTQRKMIMLALAVLLVLPFSHNAEARGRVFIGVGGAPYYYPYPPYYPPYPYYAYQPPAYAYAPPPYGAPYPAPPPAYAYAPPPPPAVAVAPSIGFGMRIH